MGVAEQPVDGYGRQEDTDMVAETKDNVMQMFDNMNETFRVAMDAGRRSQESFVRSMGDMWKNPAGFDTFYARGEKFAREFMPFIGRNMETMAESFDTSFRANLDAFRTAANVSMKTEDTDLYRRTRQVFDAAFDAMRTNFEAFGKAGARTMENWSTFCKSSCCEEAGARPGPKQGK